MTVESIVETSLGIHPTLEPLLQNYQIVLPTGRCELQRTLDLLASPRS